MACGIDDFTYPGSGFPSYGSDAGASKTSKPRPKAPEGPVNPPVGLPPGKARSGGPGAKGRMPGGRAD